MRRADVSLRTKQAEVIFDPAQVTIEQMFEAIDRLGFRASQKDSSAERPSHEGKRRE